MSEKHNGYFVRNSEGNSYPKFIFKGRSLDNPNVWVHGHYFLGEPGENFIIPIYSRCNFEKRVMVDLNTLEVIPWPGVEEQLQHERDIDEKLFKPL